MKHLLKISDLKKSEIMTILNFADQLKFNRKIGIHKELLKNKTLGMIFRKSSTRTRVSFEAGIFQLGGHALFLSDDIQLNRGEPICDTAAVLSRYVDGIMIRTFQHEEAEMLAQFSTVPVINGLTDLAHPCQILADLATIREYHSTLEGTKVCFIGDGNNVCNSLIAGAAIMGMQISVACPKGYEPDKGVIEFAGDALTITQSPEEAAYQANVVYTDVWASMGQEVEAEARKELFKNYQVNTELLKAASPKAIVLHCLPAHRGEEISSEVLEAHYEEVLDQAENRMHVQKAVMCMLMSDNLDEELTTTAAHPAASFFSRIKG